MRKKLDIFKHWLFSNETIYEYVTKISLQRNYQNCFCSLANAHRAPLMSPDSYQM